MARFSRGGVVLGYFFGPRWKKIPDSQEIGVLLPQDAILVRLIGDLGLLNGEWPIIDSIADWEVARWSLPKFSCPNGNDPDTYYLLTYDPKRLGTAIDVETIKREDAKLYPEDGLSGYGAIEIRLTQLLSKDDD